MQPDPNVDSAAAARLTTWLRGLVAGLFALTMTGLVELGVLSRLMHSSSEALFRFQNAEAVSTIALSLMLVSLITASGLIFVVLRYRTTWRGLMICWVGTLPVLLWLSWDESEVQAPLSIEQFSPEFAGAKESYDWLMQYTSGQPSGETNSFMAENFRHKHVGAQTKDKAKWLKVVAAQRNDIEVMWSALEPQHRWMTGLNAFDRIADLTPLQFDAKLMRFDVWRTLSQYQCAQATLLALDGKGDEAITLLLPLLEVSYKLQPSARTMVRMMIAVMVEKSAVETALIVLDTTEVTPKLRGQLASLMQRGNPAEGARRLVLAEYVFLEPHLRENRMGDALTVFNGLSRSWIRPPLNAISSLLINPVATINRYGDHIYPFAELAASRQLNELSLQTKDFVLAIKQQGGMKNLGGRFILGMSLPNYDRVLETYWSAQDLRMVLLARCESGNAPVD